MVYRFSDIYSPDLYASGNVIFVFGNYEIFNNIVIDRCKKIALPENDEVVTSTSFLDDLMNELPTTKSSMDQTSTNTLDFNSFMEMKETYPMEGRWYCNVDYKMLTEKQKDTLKEYMKFNSKAGLLVVSVKEFKDFRLLLKNKVIANSKTTHSIQLTYPPKNMLLSLLDSEFRKRDVIVAEAALKLFIMRLSNAYNDYSTLIESIADKYKGLTIGYDEMMDSLKGVDNYILDDFLEALTKPIKNKKFIKNRKIYKMYSSLVDSLSAETVVKRLIPKVEMMIELRILINNGTLPVLVRYSASEIQEELPKESKLKTLSTYSFKRYARLASLTTLKDWYYMKMILQGNEIIAGRGFYKGNSEYNHILLSLIHRSIYSTNRLMNDIGILNVVDGELAELNAIYYNPYLNRTEDALMSLIDKVNNSVALREDERRRFGEKLEKSVKSATVKGSSTSGKKPKSMKELQSIGGEELFRLFAEQKK